MAASVCQVRRLYGRKHDSSRDQTNRNLITVLFEYNSTSPDILFHDFAAIMALQHMGGRHLVQTFLAMGPLLSA